MTEAMEIRSICVRTGAFSPDPGAQCLRLAVRSTLERREAIPNKQYPSIRRAREHLTCGRTTHCGDQGHRTRKQDQRAQFSNADSKRMIL